MTQLCAKIRGEKISPCAKAASSPRDLLSTFLQLFPSRRDEEVFLQSGEGEEEVSEFGRSNPEREMPRIPMIRFPKRHLKAPSPSAPAVSQPADQHGDLHVQIGG